MTRFVAFLRAVNVGSRRVAMGAARDALTELGYDDVSSFVNSGNLLFTKLTSAETKRVEAMSNDRDEVLVRGRDVHWLIHTGN